MTPAGMPPPEPAARIPRGRRGREGAGGPQLSPPQGGRAPAGRVLPAAAGAGPARGAQRGRRSPARAAHARSKGGVQAVLRGVLPQAPNRHACGAGLPGAAATQGAGWGMGLGPSAGSPATQADEERGADKIQAAGGAGRSGTGAGPNGGIGGAERAAAAGQPPRQPQSRPGGGQGARAGPHLDLELAYTIPDPEYVAKGQVVRPDGFDAYMHDRVGPKHLDAHGAEIIRGMFGRVGMTGFEKSVLDVLLSPSPSAKQPWRVGESLAECFLEDYEEALFPYPYSRDVKDERASHAGADLVGYSLGGPNGETMFLFGETKTSGEPRRPPRVARSLGDQLDALCSPKVQKTLVRRLTFRADAQGDQRLRALHVESMLSYRARKFRLVGVLIRYPNADRKDLEAAFDRAKASRCARRLDLISLYLPVPVERLGDML